MTVRSTFALPILFILISGCSSTPKLPLPSDKEASKYEKEYLTKYEQLKSSFSDQSEVKLMQPANKMSDGNLVRKAQLSDSYWIELEQIIEDQLKLQVDLSLEHHHNFMLRHGLSDCQKVMDIGTGNGLFISKIAEKHPQIQFHGIDNKPHMVEKAKSRYLPNCSWSLGDALDQNTGIALSTTNGILMRYVVLHMPNTREALSKIGQKIPSGTKLWIFDLDLDHYICKPEQPEFILVRDLVKTFCDQHSVEIRVSTKLPPILEEAGFKVTGIEIEPFNNQEVDHQRFAEYVFREALLYNHFLGNASDSEAMKKIENFLFNVMDKNKHFVQYGMIMISAEKI